MSTTPGSNDIRNPLRVGSEGGGRPADQIDTGRLDKFNVIAGSGGKQYAAVHDRSTGESRQDDGDEETRSLAEAAQACADQIVVDLHLKLGLPLAEARKQLKFGLQPIFDTHLERIASETDPDSRNQATREFRGVLESQGNVESQIRSYAVYALQQIYPAWPVDRRAQRARMAPLPDLMLELGYDDQSIQRYYEQVLRKREAAGADVLVGLGFDRQRAADYLRELRQRRPENPLFDLQEIIEIGRSPGQHPLYGRAAGDSDKTTLELRQQRLEQELDSLMFLRSTAREVLRGVTSSDEVVQQQLRTLSRAELEAIAGVVQTSPATPFQVPDVASAPQASQKRTREWWKLLRRPSS